MMEVFIYPVSGVMKLWHLMLHNAFGVDDQVAWLISLFGLIVTVRSIILPLAWKQFQATRMMVNMRPRIKALRDSFAERTDADADKEERAALNALYKEQNFNPKSGCFPALVQIPVFIGLYQLLLRMARPVEGFNATTIHPIGFLGSDEVRAFLKVRIWDVPVPSYVAMQAEQLQQLGTNRDDVFWFVLPLVVVATFFTIGNMSYSISRSYLTIDHENRIALRMNRIVIGMVLIMPLVLINAAMYSPVPAAIVVYWVANNLWTLGQIVVLNFLLDKKYPLTQEFESFQDEAFERRVEQESERKLYQWDIRKRRLLMLVQPHKFLQHYAELRVAKQEKKEKLRSEQQARKEVRRQRNAAKRQRREELKAAKLAQQNGQQQPEAAPPSVEDTPTDQFEQLPPQPSELPQPEETPTDEFEQLPPPPQPDRPRPKRPQVPRGRHALREDPPRRTWAEET
ncbi:membrane protein insertase YidC [Corynebacterium sp.]|uniref:membrane protein insertase YidC n=1 Tax=Corynebacterium sp. TaxID=1720 RepID=UPI0026DA9F0A|nr:membrane protein insertase YidC [Corynebacterium sp.]MDO5076691.1 membrane protein insertase YidC [Corynebacterium sp.]